MSESEETKSSADVRLLATPEEARAFATQTSGSFRRPVEPQPVFPEATVREVMAQFPGETLAAIVNQVYQDGWVEERCPYGEPATRLWVAEEWATSTGARAQDPERLAHQGWPVWYSADGSVRYTGASQGGPAFMTRGDWQPAESMPRWACRAVAEVTDVQVAQVYGVWTWVVSWKAVSP